MVGLLSFGHSSEIENFKRKLEVFKRSSEIVFFKIGPSGHFFTVCVRDVQHKFKTSFHSESGGMATLVGSEKLQNESSLNFSNCCSGFCPEFWDGTWTARSGQALPG